MRHWLGLGLGPLPPHLFGQQPTPPPSISGSLVRALVVIATVTQEISHLVARA